MKPQFKGWYFKHQNQTETLSVIPGYCKDYAFIQIITDSGSYMFKFPSLHVKKGAIYIGKCIFSQKKIILHLPNINGTLSYGSFQKLSSDIMGPFRFFPMECRHSIYSMAHRVNGNVIIDNKLFCFDNGKGYIEGDSGTSFPSSYLWLQCNDFNIPCSIMLSIANIPFCGMHFTGCICAIKYHNDEYRLATYNGVHILVNTPNHVCLSQGKMLLEIDVLTAKKGSALRSPKIGKMSGTIYENCNAYIHVRLWKDCHQIIDEVSDRASFEYM